MATLKAQLTHADTQLFLWLQQRFCGKCYLPLFRAISTSGDGWAYALLALGWYLLDANAGVQFVATALIAFSLQVSVYLVLKNQFKRDRPADCIASFQAKITPADQFSFPSGHSAAAAVMATLVILFAPSLTWIAIVWAGLIATSRVVLGVHFPGDIFAGALLGVGCAIGAQQILQSIEFYT